MGEKVYTQKQVEYMLKLEYRRGLKDGEKETKETIISFLENKRG